MPCRIALNARVSYVFYVTLKEILFKTCMSVSCVLSNINDDKE